MNKTLAVALVVIQLCSFSFCSVASASDAAVKLGRGVTNIVTGPLEIFRQMGKVSEDNHWSVGFFGGLFKGLGTMLVREVAGVYEVITFPFPLPAEYESVIDPATVFERSSDTL